ncbi:MAG TPA: hypothetical protein VKV57_02345 [bacterium]|nr:hypothetical protein [bacterium]
MTLCAIQHFPTGAIRSFLEQVAHVEPQEALIMVGDSRVSDKNTGDFADGAVKLFVLNEDVAVAVAGNVAILEKVLKRTAAILEGGLPFEPFPLATRIYEIAQEASAELELRECQLLLAARHPKDHTLAAFVIDLMADPPVRMVTDLTAVIGSQKLCEEYRSSAEQADRDNPGKVPGSPEEIALRMFGVVDAVAQNHPGGVVGTPINCIIMDRTQIGYYPGPPHVL